MNSTGKTVLVYALMLAGLVCLWRFVGKPLANPHGTTISMTELLNDANQGKVAEITVNSGSSSTSSKVTGKYKDGSRFNTTVPVFSPDLYRTLQEHGVRVSVADQNSKFGPIAMQYLTILLPVILTFGLILPAWQIVKKAGFPAPLSLLLLIPFVNLAAIYIFAFSPWKVVPVSQSVNQ